MMLPEWVHHRPAPTLVGTRRAAGGIIVGRRLADDGEPPRYPGGWDRSVGLLPHQIIGVRVSISEAGVVQGFPPDHPWQGSTLQQAQQVGNAIHPPLALALLRAVTGSPT